jgi:tRNA 2-selenouridine synthase
MEGTEQLDKLLDPFFDPNKKSNIIDVRTPAEFELGHIIGAKNIPLLSNEERVEIGTLYKQTSPEQAFDRGIELVGPKMHTFLKEARQIIGNEKATIYCWRGGKRSQSMSWLFDMAGFKTTTIPGGYKAYRKRVARILSNKELKLIVLGGKTGSGKTKILHELLEQREQIIDLEGLANHKGSAFGWIGESAQPSIEHFENLLAHKIMSLDLSKPIWIENESRMIGRIALQEDFWLILKASPLINISIPDKDRVKHLIDTYSKDDPRDLIVAFEKIQKRLGGLRLRQAIDSIDNGDYANAAAIALTYYDKSYTKLLEKNETEFIYKIKFEHGIFSKIAEDLIAYKHKMK